MLFEVAVFVHREIQFNKLLSNLRKAGGKAAQAAVLAEHIMEKLAAAESGLRPSHVHRLTRHGEARIEGCGKFDLGSGYRLVHLKKGDHLFFSYIGTHDDCDHWIKSNRGLQPEHNAGIPRLPVREKCGESGDTEENEYEVEPDCDDLLMERIDDRTLRRIFRGLCGTGR
jgi:hypothetical protein